MKYVDREKIEANIVKGTTTLGIVCKDGVVLATDTRVTAGMYVAHRYGKKVYEVDRHLGITIAGVVADAQNVVEILKANARLYRLSRGRPMPVASAARLAANILFSSRGFPLIIQALIGGLDDTGPHIYSIDPFGSITEETCVATGSGSPVAYGVIEDQYRADMTIKDAVVLASKAVLSAMRRNVATGDSYDIVVIDGIGYRELSDGEKQSIEASIKTPQ
jgi:proteasome beta subunit